MTLRFLDGFDHYAYADITKKWTATGSNMSLSTSSSNTRGGVGGCISVTNGQSCYLRKDGLTNATTYVIGMSIKVTTYPTDYRICTFYDGTSTQVSFRLLSNGGMTAYRGNGDTSIASSSAGIISGTSYHHVEIKLVVDASAGSLEVRVDGASVWTGSSLNTKGSSTTNINGVAIGSSSGVTGSQAACQLYVDDFFALDNAGSVNNDFLGDRRVYTVLPNGAGAHSQWTPDSGSNYARVNEASADGDTSYVSDSTANDLDSYTFAALPAGVSSVDALQFNHWARKDDIGTRTIAALQRNGSGTEAVGATSANLTNGAYVDMLTLAETSLVSGTAWTLSEIAGSQFGTKVIA